MTNNGKLPPRCNVYRYNYILANIDRLKILSFLKDGPRTWMETFSHIYDLQKGNFSYLLDGMREDCLIRMAYFPEKKQTVLYATHFGLEKMRQTQEEISKL